MKKNAQRLKETPPYKESEWQQYLTRPVEQLEKILPKWACGKYLQKAMYTRDFLEAGCTIHYASLKEVIATLEFGEVRTDSFFTGSSTNDIKVARLLHRWDHNAFVDPPNIFVQEGQKKNHVWRWTSPHQNCLSPKPKEDSTADTQRGSIHHKGTVDTLLNSRGCERIAIHRYRRILKLKAQSHPTTYPYPFQMPTQSPSPYPSKRTRAQT